MRQLQTTYTIQGADKSPRAYLEGLRELLDGQIATRETQRAGTSTQSGKRVLGGEIRGLELARNLLDGVVAGMDES